MGKMIASSSSVLCFGRSFLSSRTKQLGFYFWLFAIKFYDAQVTENRGSWWLIKAKEIQWQLFSKLESSIRSQHLINKLSLQPSLQPRTKALTFRFSGDPFIGMLRTATAQIQCRIAKSQKPDAAMSIWILQIQTQWHPTQIDSHHKSPEDGGDGWLEVPTDSPPLTIE